MTAPSIYVLGSKPELDATFRDINGDPFIPLLVSLDIKEPWGTIITVSGGISIPTGDIITTSGANGEPYMYYLYQPSGIGWFEYQFWGRDGNDREIASTNGFEVIDHVY